MKLGVFEAQSLDQVMAARKGHTTGFDYLRIGLSLAVLFVHCLWISDVAGWQWLWSSWTGPIERSILPAFFILSGYLVVGSLFRNSMPQFVALRVVRLVPALAVEIVLTALGLGLVFTTLSTSDYLRSPEFHAYFLNIIGYIHYTLPGVFGGQQLNVQLWTIPYELECYVLIVTLALLGLVQRRKLLFSLLIFGAVAGAALSYRNGWPTLQSVVSGRVLVLGFLAGMAIYQFRDRIPYNKYVFLASCAATYILFAVPHMNFLGVIPLAYATVYFGTLKLPKVPFGDLSYGVYLFHFPIAFTLHQVSGGTLAWWELTPLVIAITGLFAMGSWTLIEHPTLKRKKQVLAFVDRAMATFTPRDRKARQAPLSPSNARWVAVMAAPAKAANDAESPALHLVDTADIA
jgi:peptidoglycan/LPS O-acetylase OafA/YrhL